MEANQATVLKADMAARVDTAASLGMDRQLSRGMGRQRPSLVLQQVLICTVASLRCVLA